MKSSRDSNGVHILILAFAIGLPIKSLSLSFPPSILDGELHLDLGQTNQNQIRNLRVAATSHIPCHQDATDSA